tara:strand:+ start:937 stop:1647 length:711 start_codon:yes stop_codon:yes gene_type:complete
MKSSYIQHNYGSLIRALIKVTSPICCVEVGILDGFSTIIIGHSLKELSNGDDNDKNHCLFAYDLFEKYPYTHSKYADVKSRIDKFGLDEFIHLKQKDLFDAVNDFEPNSIDFMHVDVSNTGEIVKNVVNCWDKKIRPGGLLLFEGGSPLRDEVSWMKRYKKDKINKEIKSNNTLKTKYSCIILHNYPSMVICSKNIQVDHETWEKFKYGKFEEGARHDEMDDNDLLQFLSGNYERI